MTHALLIPMLLARLHPFPVHGPADADECWTNFRTSLQKDSTDVQLAWLLDSTRHRQRRLMMLVRLPPLPAKRTS